MAGTPDATVPRVVLAGGTNLSHALVQGKAVVIGRAKGVGMRIPHPSVSPMHCELVWDGGGVLLRDIGSELGTKVSGRAVTEPVVLEPGDLISVGIFTVEFQWDMLPEEEPESPEDAGQLAVHEVPLREPAPTRSGSRPPVLFRGGTVTEIPLDHALTIGSSSDADVVISGSSISPVHARVERVKDGFEIIDEGETGTLINGKYFERHSLTVGDFINIGSDFWFTYDGFALRRVEGASGCGLVGREIAVRGSHGHLILKDATFRADPGQFVGILGPSGAGKTTLLRALSGLVPLSEGEVLLDGKPLDEIPDPSEYLGFVPQQEIVHLELTGRMALRYSARLRLPKRTPAHEIAKLIDRLAGRLGLSEHLDKPAAQLSGGQLKRLSVCVELLNRPSLLFLDEPTSGLDPESETELMQQLQELTYTGCTVVCTTHLMENVYLLNSLEVVMAGRDEETGESIPGTGIFRGRPREARDFFGVRSLTKLYARLHEQSPPSWKKAFAEAFPGRVEAPPKVVKNGVPPRRARRWAVPVLLRRQRAILCSDWKNLLLLAGQPVLIALLIASVATGDTAGGTKLFLAYIATLWLGCSNAATEIVRERSIFRREQFVGLSSFSYLTSKSLWMGALTAAQALLIFGILKVAGSGLTGSALWQLGGLIASACAATGIGLSISAWAKTSLQAVLLVPVIIIPQILFSGFVFPVQDWNESAAPRIASRFFPSFAAQRVMDTSLLWDRPIANYFDLEEEGLHTAFDNLSTALYPLSAWLSPDKGKTFTLHEATLYRVPEGKKVTLDKRTVEWSKNNPPSYRIGLIFHDHMPGVTALATLSIWAVATFGIAWLLLCRRSL